MTGAGRVRVIIADDQHLVRAGLRLILEAEGDIDVVGEAVDGIMAVRLAEELHPDVVLLDVQMPALDGLGAAHQILAPGGLRPKVLPGGRGRPDIVDRLTSRELEVFRLLARGLSNQEIAGELFLGETTVKTHVARILAKLGVRDRVQAVVLAHESGVVGFDG